MSEPEQPPKPISTDRDMRRTQRGLGPRDLALEQEPRLQPATQRGFGAVLELMRSLPPGKAPQAHEPIVASSLARTDPGWGPSNPAQGPKTLRGFGFVAGGEPERDVAWLPPMAAAPAPQPGAGRADAASPRVAPAPLAPRLRAPQPSAATLDTRADGLAETLRQSPASAIREITLHVLAAARNEAPASREHSRTIIVARHDPPLELVHGAAACGHDPRARAAHEAPMVWGMRTQRPGLDDSGVDRLAGAFRWTAIASNLFDERSAPDAAASARGERRSHRLVLALGAALALALAFGAVYPTRVSVRVPAVLEDSAPPQLLAAGAAGTLQELRVRVDDEVSAGQVLLTLADAELDARRAAAARELERANQATRELESGRAAHERTAQELRARVESAEQRLRAESARAKKLSEQRVALQGLEEQGSVVQKSIAALSLELGAVAQQVRPLELELARTQLQLASFERGRSEQLQRAAADVEAAQRTSAGAEALLERTQLRAPRAGRIRALSVRIGDAVRAGQALVALAPLAAPTRAVAHVAARDRATLRVGQQVRLELDHPRRAVAASVRAIDARAQTNGARRVELTLNPSVPALRAGSGAHLLVTAKREPPFLRWLELLLP